MKLNFRTLRSFLLFPCLFFLSSCHGPREAPTKTRLILRVETYRFPESIKVYFRNDGPDPIGLFDEAFLGDEGEVGNLRVEARTQPGGRTFLATRFPPEGSRGGRSTFLLLPGMEHGYLLNFESNDGGDWRFREDLNAFADAEIEIRAIYHGELHETIARSKWVKALGFQIPTAEIQMNYVPEGKFSAYEGEKPGFPTQRLVRITKPFWLSNREVTQYTWNRIMDISYADYLRKNRSSGAGVVALDPELPVSWVLPSDALDFCHRLENAMRSRNLIPKGYELGLPTEAQWRYACRAENRSVYSFGSCESDLSRFAWYAENTTGGARTVGTKPPNHWGFFDMHGNVSEFCIRMSIKPGVYEDPVGDGKELLRDPLALIGGNWASQASDCSLIAFPITYDDEMQQEFDKLEAAYGFRVALRPLISP